MQPTSFPCNHRWAGLAAAAVLALAGAGCALTPQHASTNTAIAASAPPAGAPPVRASVAINGRRGNPRVLMLLALSGGGSRSAYFGSQVMMQLQNTLPDTDLLAEVDVISAVSGGALPAAYYALSRDEFLRRPALARQLAPALSDGGALRMLSADVVAGTVKCTAALPAAARAELEKVFDDDSPEFTALIELCEQHKRTDRRLWSAAEVRTQMTKNYLRRLFLNFFWPTNFLSYWFTSFDRADIMAQTFADNLFDTPTTGHDFKFADIDPARPYLILNATNATEQTLGRAAHPDEMPFGSVFTFTQDDFNSQLGSDIGSYSVSRAVMASGAFPVVFPAMSLCDFRDPAPTAGHTASDCKPQHYLHVFDGGNADNLGLKSVKRVLLQQFADGRLKDEYDAVVVVLVDAYATPSGISRGKYDPRELIDFVVDTNVTDAVDSLLRTNRFNLLKEFSEGRLKWSEQDCQPESRELPPALCDALHSVAKGHEVSLEDKLVFHHIGFGNVANTDLRRRLNAIPTSFTIDSEGINAIDLAVAEALSPRNLCLKAIETLVNTDLPTPLQVLAAREDCRPPKQQPLKQPRIAARGAPTVSLTPSLDAVPPVRSARSENTAP